MTGGPATVVPNEEEGMDRPGIVTFIDEAIERFAVRERVSGGEVVDFLLDLRSVVVSDEALRTLLEEEAQPTA
jgi:hypothetical protein